jgi:hypothetical protein
VLRIITVIALLVSLPSVAIPCINATLLRGDKATRQVKLAENLLEKGKYEQAARKTDPMRYDFQDEALTRRARIIHAVATMRGDSARARRSLAQLQEMLRPTSDDPYLSARVAEALVLQAESRTSDSLGSSPLGQDEARRLRGDAFAMLIDLDKRDLMPDAMAYVTLAQLQHRNGEAAARDASLARCRKMTRRRAICTVR